MRAQAEGPPKPLCLYCLKYQAFNKGSWRACHCDSVWKSCAGSCSAESPLACWDGLSCQEAGRAQWLIHRTSSHHVLVFSPAQGPQRGCSWGPGVQFSAGLCPTRVDDWGITDCGKFILIEMRGFVRRAWGVTCKTPYVVQSWPCSDEAGWVNFFPTNLCVWYLDAYVSVKSTKHTCWSHTFDVFLYIYSKKSIFHVSNVSVTSHMQERTLFTRYSCVAPSLWVLSSWYFTCVLGLLT